MNEPYDARGDSIFDNTPKEVAQPTSWPELTPREANVAAELVVGNRNSEIAGFLGISIKTVDTHRGHILKKLDCRNNVDLTRLAIRRGYSQP